MKGLGHCVLEHFQSRIKRVCNGCQLNTLGGFLSIKIYMRVLNIISRIKDNLNFIAIENIYSPLRQKESFFFIFSMKLFTACDRMEKK